MAWWNESEGDLPADASEVEESLTKGDIVDDQVILINAWTKSDSVLELG